MQLLDRSKQYFNQYIMTIQIVVASNLTINNSAQVRLSSEG